MFVNVKHIASRLFMQQLYASTCLVQGDAYSLRSISTLDSDSLCEVSAETEASLNYTHVWVQTCRKPHYTCGLGINFQYAAVDKLHKSKPLLVTLLVCPIFKACAW